jgi:hypothetical protein
MFLITSVAILFLMKDPVLGYSVLAHQAIIDTVWESSFKPVLLNRFPNISEDELRKARAHAYGGSLIQDLGYYPFGNRFFTNLLHYVRSGDFLEAMIQESQTIEEYAFALGALSHYAADNTGHQVATNRAVPILYPKLRAKFGNVVTFADKPSAHLKTEFGFDVLQVARGRYGPPAYLEFIGFEIHKELLARAFKKTYNIEIEDVFANLDLSLGTFRFAANTLIPKFTKAAWASKRDEIAKLSPGMTRAKFVYSLPRRDYEKRWGTNYRKPGFLTNLLAFLMRVMPKLGVFSAFSFKLPTPETEAMFINSFNATVGEYTALLKRVQAGRISFENRDYDTGRPTRPGEYQLADEAYGELLIKLAEHKFQGVSPELRENILAYFRDPAAPHATKKDKGDWLKIQRALEEFRALTN